MTLPRVVAAVDFGTHGVGFAWTRVTDHEIHTYDRWPDQPEPDPKNLTALLVDAGGRVAEWGYRAKQRAKSQRTARKLTYYAHFKIGTAVAGSDAVQLTSMLLAEVYRAALREITTAAGLGDGDIAWRLTVPATWADRERQLMRIAAEQAGFPAGERLELVIEPEAAVLHCWNMVGLAVPGTRFVVVDAGRGVVDVASYVVGGTSDRPTLAELGKATGGPFGAGAVDRRFLDLVTARLGEDVVGALLAGDATRLPFLDAWEQAKRASKPYRKSSLSIAIPSTIRARFVDARGGVDPAVVLRPKEVRALFDPVIDPVIKLVREHVAGAGPRCHVLLVGGFAQSPYLVARFRRAFPEQRVLVPPRPAHAVLLGAVRSGIEPDVVVARISRFTYGVNTNMMFERGKDPRERRFKDGYGHVRCRDRFAIFVHAGQTVAVGTTVEQRFQPLDPADTLVGLALYTAERPDPRYTDAEGSVRVGELTVDVSATAGRQQHEREIQVIMTFGNAEITVRASDLHTGTELTTTIDFVTDG